MPKARRHDLSIVEQGLTEALLRLGVEAGSTILIAFSGGPDSCALAWALRRLAASFRLRLVAVHIDHGLDSASAARAESARQLAETLGLAFLAERLPPRPATGTSLEAWARQQRYAALERQAERLDDRQGRAFIATAHHADDQAETVVLRWLFGSGLDGLGGIRPRFGRRIRPLLAVPRAELEALVEATGLEPVCDPTNSDLRVPRNRIRHRLLAEWYESTPDLRRHLTRLADATRAAVPRIDQVLAVAIGGHRTHDGAACQRAAFEGLPPMLHPHALAALERLAGRPLPTPATARAELLRQLDSGAHHVGSDAGKGWRWHADRISLRLVAPLRPVGQFTYTLGVPGLVAIPELDLEMSLTVGATADWMFRGHPDRTALCPTYSTDPSQHATVQIRNRRPGDRIRPLGSRRSKRLKDLLIDRRIPRERRDRLPLLVVNDIVAWVPGVALDDRFRLTDEPTAWIAELRPASRAGRQSPPGELSPVSDKTEKGRTP